MSDINWKNKCWVVTIFLVRDDGKVLLTWNNNLQTWIPVGGHIEPGETPEQAVVREVKEETGFDFEFLKNSYYEKDRVKVISPYRFQIEKVPHHNYHMNFVFIGKCTKYSNKQKNDDNEELRWFSEKEIINMRKKMLESVWKISLIAINSTQTHKYF
jgi:8-oxo-dGTP pyrophosphatase MutT (NUDIX family)